MICIIPYFFRKLGKMSQNMSSTAVLIGALRVNSKLMSLVDLYYIHQCCFLSRQATSFRPVETKESQVVKIDASKVCIKCAFVNLYSQIYIFNENRADSFSL